MGNREALLAAAKTCLRDKGFTRTTARDLASASGVSLAAIGYHFGSKEALLSQALVEATGEWIAELRLVLVSDLDPEAAPIDRFQTVWTRLLEFFHANRQLWAASFEVSPHIDRMPEVRQVIAAAQEEARLGLAEMFQGAARLTDAKSTRAVGAFYYALLAGVMTQWLVDPARAPSARDLTTALRVIAAETT